MRILGGDIGGTNTRLALYEPEGSDLREVENERYPSTEHDGLRAIIDDFLTKTGATCLAAGLGVPGPVEGRSAKLTNLPWLVDADEIESSLGISRVVLLNDLQASARGIPSLDSAACTLVKAGRSNPDGPRSVIAAGTGLGMAGLLRSGTSWHAFASEGGHASFSPCAEVEIDLLRHLALDLGHVSWERVVSGPGLVTVYTFLRTCRTSETANPDGFADPDADPAAVVAEAARSGRCPIAAEAVRLFSRLFGSVAGNQALTLGATGGVFLTGGIAPKILDEHTTPDFVEGFLHKGRMRTLLERIPITLVDDDHVAVRGAAEAASDELGDA